MDPGIKPAPPELQADSLPLEPSVNSGIFIQQNDPLQDKVFITSTYNSVALRIPCRGKEPLHTEVPAVQFCLQEDRELAN